MTIEYEIENCPVQYFPDDPHINVLRVFAFEVTDGGRDRIGYLDFFNDLENDTTYMIFVNIENQYRKTNWANKVTTPEFSNYLGTSKRVMLNISDELAKEIVKTLKYKTTLDGLSEHTVYISGAINAVVPMGKDLGEAPLG